MKKYRPVRAHFDFWGYKPCVLLCMALAAGIFAKAQSVTCTPSRIAFATSVATGHTSASQNFTVEVANLSGSAITLQPSSQVQVSLEDTDKAYVRTPITIAADELAKGKPVYVRFAPTCNGFSDSVVSSSIIFLSQRNELLGSVAVTGAVRQEGAGGGQPFKVATFNAEWLGCPSNGPDDKTLQMRNVATVISEMDADIVALQEVANNPIQSIDTVLAHLGSAWGGHIVPHNPSSCAQSEAVIYKKSRATLTGTPYLLSNAGSASAWSSGRYPVEFSFNISADNRTIPITLVNLHAKAFSDTTSYSRRVQASLGLKTLLDGSSYSTQNLIVLGDFNDDIDASTYKKLASPYKNFVDDSLHYRFLTSAISASVSMIDHIMVSNELFPYVYGNAQREDDIVNDVNDYTATTSDHLPVSATLAFGKVGHDLPVPDLYTVKYDDGASFDLPVYNTGNQPLSYAIDSGVIASLSNRRVTFFDTGVVRMVVWQPGSVSYTPAAKFFHIRVTSRDVAPQIIVQPVGQSVALRATAVFSVQATGTALLYQWKKDGQKIAGATSFRHVVSNANNPNIGYYSCEVRNSMGSVASQAAPLCVNTSCPTLTTAVDKTVFERHIRLYPNPVQQMLFIESGAGNIAEVRIYSASGAMVYRQQGIHAPTLSVNTSGWESGIYVAAMVSDKGEKTAKTLVKK